MMRRMLVIISVMLLSAGASWAFQEKAGGKEKTVDAEKEKDVTKPVLVEKTVPKYPVEAKKEKIQGAVKLDAVIDKEGRILELKAIESPDERLTKAAMEAVKEWKFKPAMNSKGKPVQVKVTLTVNFKLQ